jgi:hypothetical protein
VGQFTAPWCIPRSPPRSKHLETLILSTEVSHLNGALVTYGTPGSVKLDVVEGDLLVPTAVYDLKTGSATLAAARGAQSEATCLWDTRTSPLSRSTHENNDLEETHKANTYVTRGRSGGFESLSPTGFPFAGFFRAYWQKVRAQMVVYIFGM